MQKILLFIFCSLLFSCQQEDLLEEPKGDLALTVQCANVDVEHLSRAVADGLIVEIWKNGVIYTEGERIFRFVSGSFPRILSLPIGEYTVKAFSECYEKAGIWNDEELGEGIYYAETSVHIKADCVNTIELAVPMLNVGLSFSLPEAIFPYVYSYVFIVTQPHFQGQGTRTVKFREGQVVFLDAAPFTCQLQVTNSDGEVNTMNLHREEVVPGTHYKLCYTLETDGTVIMKVASFL